MNYIDIKKFIASIIWLVIAVVIFSFFPLIAFFLVFKNSGISKEPTDWGSLGSYLSGTSGIILAFFAVTFSLISIYLTAKMSKFIQERDFDYRDKQAKKDIEYRDKQAMRDIEIIHAQTKPYPYFDLVKFPELTSISIENMGLGPLIITEIYIIHKKVRYQNFFKLFRAYNIQDKNVTQIKINTAPNHVLAPNKSKNLLEISPSGNMEIFNPNHNYCRSILKDCEIFLKYEDIFGNEFKHSKELSFLWNDFPPFKLAQG